MGRPLESNEELCSGEDASGISIVRLLKFVRAVALFVVYNYFTILMLNKTCFPASQFEIYAVRMFVAVRTTQPQYTSLRKFPRVPQLSPNGFATAILYTMSQAVGLL